MSDEGAQALAGLMAEGVPRLSGIELPAPEPAPIARSFQADEWPAGEPRFDPATTADIQGNVIPGFNKDHQRFLFLRIDDLEGARAWLRWLAPRLSSMQEVLDFRREFRRERLRTGAREPTTNATWVAFALSAPAVAKLLGDDALAEMSDEAFRQGLAARSTYLGDPADPAAPGHRDRWRVGGERTEADFLVTVAADSAVDAEAEASAILEGAARNGVSVVFAQAGENLPGNLGGHEHFGFKDGVSQPGVRGATADGELLAPRYLDPRNPHARIFGKAGQPLVWPGQFVLGMPRQNPADPLLPAVDDGVFPDWARLGSYLVCRRLAQDVPAFWDFAATASAEYGTDPVHFASLMVGRWPSGAPVSRTPDRDDLDLAGDEFAHNHFQFDDDTRAWTPVPSLVAGGYRGDGHSKARADVFGDTCPMAGHIRKVNPRDSGTDFGAPADTMMRLMLRRGIPYGPVLAGVADPSPELVAAERGLMFVAHMASIEDQFEFVTRRWANSAHQPNAGGHDPVIGQADVYGARDRSFDVRTSSGQSRTFILDREWVTPTGGGYFFAPAISAVGGHLAGAGISTAEHPDAGRG
ncbi:Dyp-type peroxidase [Microbacterium trichothecenolyticum]|uniref:Dyp-type peroxidase n=1 Tax=Microbacterium ureisolvens TaxID=2781186 RepID=A0ABS7I261_9MICO|nr:MULTISPECIES: Dyp-type peroxidase [Microbacterium]MBW9110578.1 Dyp-type peroxidase [Microbacterium ureisolvens]MBW9119655.1 Dyp-type peroxidase [Microbacterium trichothecenolyticum]